MNRNTYVDKPCEDCAYPLRRVDKRTRFCKRCVRSRHAAAMQRADVKANLAASELEKTIAKVVAAVDFELAFPTRYWESPF